MKSKSKTKTIKLMPRNEHWYLSPKHKGVYYPGVTYVCGFLPKGQAFERYLANQESYEESRRLLEEAGLKGTHVHQKSEELERGAHIAYENSGLTDEEFQLLSFFVDWHGKYSPKVKHIELVLISDKLKLGGTCDRVYEIDGKTVLLDLKTSKSAIYDSHHIQCAAYAQMYEELHKKQIDQVAILRLTPRRKEGFEYVTRDRKEWQKDFKQFKKTYDTMMYLNDDKAIVPKIIEVPEILLLDTTPKITSKVTGTK